MTRWQRIEEVFEQVLDLPSEEQSRAIEKLCEDDAWLRERVLALARADRDVTSHSLAHIEENASRARADVEKHAGPTKIPDRIGEFKIHARLGQGGFGTVYLAEQLVPVRRTVAIKVIRAGFDTDTILARFESERKSLALLDHPNVARMISAGLTEQGLPYFSMEYVDGPPITRFCDEHRLSITDRLRLFTGVCRGISHAHQKAIVHRDIKPGNVLVTRIDGAPVAKIIDFGIAKVLHDTGEWGATLASIGQLIGTPEYMSPEQARTGGQDVDTRSDIYALGVLLHELLTGVLPFDREELKRAGPVQACRIIAELEPAGPTQRLRASEDQLEGLARSRGLESAGSLQRAIRGDLAIIITKATAREPDRRYASAEDLALDIERYIARKPIAARAPSAVYRAKKFAARHAAGLAAIAALLLLVGALAWGVQRAVHARSLIASQAAKAKAQAYEDMIVSISRATDAVARGDQPDARAALLAVPESLRGWEWRVLRGQLVEPRIVQAVRGPILHLEHSPTQDLLAIGSYYERMDVVDITTGRIVFSLGTSDSPRRGLVGVAWSPDGVLLAVGLRNEIWISDPRAPGSARRFPLPGIAVALSWSADGARLGFMLNEAGPADGAGVMNVETGRVLTQGHPPSHQCVLMHPTRPVVLWGDLAGYLHGFDYETNKTVLSTRVCGDGISSVRLSPAHDRIAAVSNCRVVALYDAETFALVEKFRTSAGATDCAFSADGTRLFVSNTAGTIQVLSTATGATLHSLPVGNFIQALTVHPRTGNVFTSDAESRIVEFSRPTGFIDLGVGAGGSFPVAWTQGPYVVAQEDRRDPAPGAFQSVSHVFDSRTGQLVDTRTSPTYAGWNPAWAGVPGEDSLAWHAQDGTLTLRDIRAQSDLCVSTIPYTLRALTGPTSKHLVLALARGGWEVRDVRTGELLHTVRLAPGIAVGNLSPDGSLVQCVEPTWEGHNTPAGEPALTSRTLRDTLTGEVIVQFEGMQDSTYPVFSADGLLCVIGGYRPQVYDTRTGKLVQTFHDSQQPADWTWFVDNSARVIGSVNGSSLQVWDTATGRAVASFPYAGLGAVLADGSIAIIGSDRALRVLRPDARPLVGE